MTDDSNKFLIIHHIHKPRINPDGPVTASKSIDFVSLVNSKIHIKLTSLVHTLHQFVQTGSIAAPVNASLAIHLCNRRLAKRNNLLVSNACGSNRFTGSRSQSLLIPIDLLQQGTASQRKATNTQ